MAKSKFYLIEELIKQYGPETALKDVLCFETTHKYICPKCIGRGEIFKEDTNLDWAGSHFEGYIECDLCKGEGYTNKKYKPKYIQDGYEEVE